MRIPALLLILAFVAAPASAFSSFEEQMTAAEFRAAGLDKLSPAELAALNLWMRTRAPTTTVAPPSTQAGSIERPPESIDRRGLPESSEDRTPVISRIQGDFDGWKGKTRFVLDNGQIWEQSESGNFVVQLNNPVVTIEPITFGGWMLRVEGYNRAIRVRRIK